jgi:hypothetical protein
MDAQSDVSPQAEAASGTDRQHVIEAYAAPDAVTAAQAAADRMDAWRDAGWRIQGQFWDTSASGPTTFEQFAFGEEALLVRGGGRLVVTYEAPSGTPRPASPPTYVAPTVDRWSGYLQLRAAGAVIAIVLVVVLLIFVILPAFANFGHSGPGFVGAGQACVVYADNPATWTPPPVIPSDCSGGYQILKP